MLKATLVGLLATQVLFVSGAVTKFGEFYPTAPEEEIKTPPQVTIECGTLSKGFEESDPPTVSDIYHLLIDGCTTKSSYFDFFQAHNISIREYATIRIHNLKEPLKSSHLKNLPKRAVLELKNVTLDNNFIDETANFDQLIDECILPELPKNNGIKAIALKNGESVGDFGDCEKLKMVDFYKWKIPHKKGWLAGCNNLIGLSVADMKETEVKSLLDGLTTLILFEAVQCELTSLPTELQSNANLTQIGLGKNKLVKISEDLKPYQRLQNIILFEDNLDLEDFSKGLVSLKNLKVFNVMNYDGCPTTMNVTATSNATEARIGDVVELNCWIDTPCLHLLQWHHLTHNLLIPFYWGMLDDTNSPTKLSFTSQAKLTTHYTVEHKVESLFICRALFPGRVKDAETITLKVVD